MSHKFIIIDGSSLMYRAFYALPLLTNANGQYTNAVYGFTNMLLKLLEDERPDCMAVALDKGKLTFRNEVYNQYKAHRKATPSELVEQFPLVREVLEAMSVPVYEQEGYEADDLIGVLATRIEQNGDQLLIVTGDRDALQLISPNVKVLLTRKGITEVERYDEQALKEKYGLTPSQMIDLKGLMGDASDNIPGLPGVGEKTALKLLQQFGSMENMLRHVDEISGKKVQETVRENAELARLSKELATIVRDLPLAIPLENCLFKPDWEKAREMFARLGFKSLVSRLTPKEGNQETETIMSAPTVECEDAKIVCLLEQIAQAKTCAFQLFTDRPEAMRGSLLGAAIACGSVSVYVDASSRHWDEVLRLLGDEGIGKITFDAKPAYLLLWRQNARLAGLLFDCYIAAYLLDPIAASYDVSRLAAQLSDCSAIPAVPGKAASLQERMNYCGWVAGSLIDLADVLRKKLDTFDMSALYYDIELPLIETLSAMEYQGITVGLEKLEMISAEVGTAIDQLTKDIYLLVGEEFNINSTRQLGLVLFEKLNLPVMKKTKTGYSTDAEVLEKLSGAHPVIDKLLEYRVLTKLKSTYLDGLRLLINPETGKIHTTFNQTVTATGRLSSSEPNLQNIPIRTEAGRRIRELFVPSNKDNVIMAADYSQIELRILAHLSKDERMIDAFLHGADIHTSTAAKVFGVDPSEVTSQMRSRAKAVNFGIVYGISDYGLSRDIGVSRKEAQQYIDNYFERFGGVQQYMHEMVETAHAQGFVATLFSRRRYLPDINSRNYNLRSFAERTAMNTPIQGSAADIMKKAMVQVYRELKAGDFKTRLLLQVHDELVLEVPPEEVSDVAVMVRRCMENAVQLAIPLTVDIKMGDNWAKAK